MDLSKKDLFRQSLFFFTIFDVYLGQTTRCFLLEYEKTDRSELEKMLGQLRSGDILVVYSLDRLGRTAKQLIELLNQFKEKKSVLKA